MNRNAHSRPRPARAILLIFLLAQIAWLEMLLACGTPLLAHGNQDDLTLAAARNVPTLAAP